MQTDEQHLAKIEARVEAAYSTVAYEWFDRMDYVRKDIGTLIAAYRALAAENAKTKAELHFVSDILHEKEMILHGIIPSKVWCVSVRFYDHDGDPSLYATEAIANAHADQLKDRLDKIREPYKNVMVYEQDVECSPPAAGEGAG